MVFDAAPDIELSELIGSLTPEQEPEIGNPQYGGLNQSLLLNAPRVLAPQTVRAQSVSRSDADHSEPLRLPESPDIVMAMTCAPTSRRTDPLMTDPVWMISITF
jgi:hypothetical protein